MPWLIVIILGWFCQLSPTQFDSCVAQEAVFTDLEEALRSPLLVEHLDLSNQDLYKLPKDIELFENLITLDLSNNRLRGLNEIDFSHMRSLLQLNLDENRIRSFPQEILTARGLVTLDLGMNFLKQFPVEVSELKFLETLRLHHNDIVTIPTSYKNKNLKRIRLDGNKILEVPPSLFRNHPKLVYLNLNHNRLSTLPTAAYASRIKTLDLGGNKIQTIAGIAKMKSLVFLVLDWNPLDEVSLLEICELSRLEVLSMEECAIKKIPESFKNLKKLKTLSLINNHLELIPDFFNDHPKLERVWLSGNKLSGETNVKSRSNN